MPFQNKRFAGGTNKGKALAELQDSLTAAGFDPENPVLGGGGATLLVEQAAVADLKAAVGYEANPWLYLLNVPEHSAPQRGYQLLIDLLWPNGTGPTGLSLYPMFQGNQGAEAELDVNNWLFSYNYAYYGQYFQASGEPTVKKATTALCGANCGGALRGMNANLLWRKNESNLWGVDGRIYQRDEFGVSHVDCFGYEGVTTDAIINIVALPFYWQEGNAPSGGSIKLFAL